MTTSDWAFIISLCSLAIALGSFVWNVWSKFIYPKAIVRVSLQATTIFQPNTPLHGFKCLTLSATNHGPGDVTIHSAIFRKHRVGWWKRWRAYYKRHYRREYGMLNPLEGFPARLDHTIGPFSGGLPKKLGVGEDFSCYFPRKVDWFENKGARLGFYDSFGRHHWCRKDDAVKAAEAVKKEANETARESG